MTSVPIQYMDKSTEPKDLLRARKCDTYDTIANIESIEYDLYCCNQTFSRPTKLNEHYRNEHAALPPSDPATWTHIIIKDPMKHAALDLQIPFIPFPKFQPLQSTWTVRATPRTEGTAEQRARRREISKKPNTVLRQEYAEMANECREAKRANRNAHKAQRYIKDLKRKIIELRERIQRRDDRIEMLQRNRENDSDY